MSVTLSQSFEEIPYDWRVPGTYIEVRPTYTNLGVLGYPTRVLLIGQMLASGSAAEAVPQRITRGDQGPGLFGQGSVLAEMCAAFRRANQTNDVYAIGLKDPVGGTAAAGSLVFTGSPTSAGTVAIYIGGERVAVNVGVGATVSDIAAAARAAIAAKPALPVIAGGAAGTVTLTAKHAGTLGNSIDLRLNRLAGEATPSGLAVAVTQLTGGAGVPDLATVLTAIAPDWYTDIACAFTDTANLALLVTELATRYMAMGRQDAHAYVGLKGSFGALSAAGAARNSQYLSMIGATSAPTSPWAWAASLAGVGAFYLTQDPARQLRSLALPGIIGPDPADRFTPTEQDLLLRDGISTFDVSLDGTVRLSRVITTYQTSPLGVDDDAWLDIMVPKTASRIRYDWAGYVGLNYPRHKLTDDGSPAAEYSDAIVTPRQMHGAWTARSKIYERLGWIEDATRTASESLFARDPDDRNRLVARQRIRIIGNLMILAASLQFEA